MRYPTPVPAARFTFPRSRRLTHARQFDAVYAAKLRVSLGPLAIFVRRNQLPHPRLGLAVGRSVGTAPQRNRVKRLIRESFRFLQHSLSVASPVAVYGGLDLVVSVKKHPLQDQAWYQIQLAALIANATRTLERREARAAPPSPPASPPPSSPGTPL